ncbi:MAG TPA: NADH:ubiquinone reductase (Na(+)-transporting) subunit C [Candidatus Marinimicrobia bacterium]|nr:NADH:ubiquinone reductase (Na(+)-transporting) subunit C [Candidatus Neomarinimicrobiota bacterium]
MQQSNTYTLLFTAIVTIILGFMLSLAATSLKERQELNITIDIKKNILRSLGFSESDDEPWTQNNIQDIFERNIKSFVVDSGGSKVPGVSVDNIVQTDQYPVYCSHISEGVIDGYAIPISGKGLWSTLYGYIALEADGITVKGITFYKHGETPGLGGEVEKEWFTSNFVGKRIVDNNGKLVSIEIIKGEVDELSPEAYHQVDGISGATMTSKGLNAFLKTDLEKYEPFFQRIRKERTN